MCRYNGGHYEKSDDSAKQEQPYLIERFDSYCKKVLRFEVMQYYHVKKIAEMHNVLIDDVPQSIAKDLIFLARSQKPFESN